MRPRTIIVLALVGLVAATCALFPGFLDTNTCRSYQDIAPGNLRALQLAERSYRDEYGAYSTELARIRFEPRGAKVARYAYVVTDASVHGFTAEARGLTIGEDGSGNWPMDGDLWRIKENGAPVVVHDVCAGLWW